MIVRFQAVGNLGGKKEDCTKEAERLGFSLGVYYPSTNIGKLEFLSVIKPLGITPSLATPYHAIFSFYIIFMS